MSASVGRTLVAVGIALVVALMNPLNGPESALTRFVILLLAGGFLIFFVAGVRRLIADDQVIDDHPSEELPLLRDSRGRLEGGSKGTFGAPTGPPGMDKGLEAMAKGSRRRSAVEHWITPGRLGPYLVAGRAKESIARL